MEDIENATELQTVQAQDFRLPTKQKKELIPYEKENYSTIEKAIIELSEVTPSCVTTFKPKRLLTYKKSVPPSHFRRYTFHCFTRFGFGHF